MITSKVMIISGGVEVPRPASSLRVGDDVNVVTSAGPRVILFVQTSMKYVDVVEMGLPPDEAVESTFERARS